MKIVTVREIATTLPKEINLCETKVIRRRMSP